MPEKAVVDLTLSDSDDEARRAPKRRRTQTNLPSFAGARRASAPARAPPGGSGDDDVILVDDDNDVVEVVEDRPASGRAGPSSNAAQAQTGPALGDDEELIITGLTGQVATRDLPHPRPDCADHAFTSGISTANAQRCGQCYCFVCDVKASECDFWGTGARERDHCNARQLGYWKRLRQAMRGGDRGFIDREYRASGPLGSGIPPERGPQQARLPFPRTGGASGTAAGPGAAGPAAAAAAAGGAAGAAGAPGGAGTGGAAPTGAASLHDRLLEAQAQRRARAEAAAKLDNIFNQLANRLDGARRPNTTPAAAAACGGGGGDAAAAAAAAAPAPAPAAAGAAGGGAGGGGVVVDVKTQPGLEPAQQPAVCTLKPMPDPAHDRDAMELGTLRFPVKAAAGTTIAALAPRLARFGFYSERLVANGATSGDRLHLENLFDSKSLLHKGRYTNKPLHLKLLPLPPLPTGALPLSTERVRKVLVVDCLGRARATYMGVRLSDSARRGQLLAALAPALRPAFSAAAEQLHLLMSTATDGSSTVSVVQPETNLDDAYFSGAPANRQLIVFRTAPHPSPTWQPSAETEAANKSGGSGSGGSSTPGGAAGAGGSGASPAGGSGRGSRSKSAAAAAAAASGTWTHMPVYVHGGAGSGGSSVSRYMQAPSWVLVQLRQFKPPSGGSEGGADSPPTLSTSQNHTTQPLSVPVLVPVREEHARGGVAADRELRRQITAALEPYRTSAPPGPGPALLLRGNRAHLTERSAAGIAPHSSSRWSMYGDMLEGGATWSGALHVASLTAVWAHQDVSDTVYRLPEMRSPAVDDSASPEALRESHQRMEEAKHRAAQQQRLKEQTDAAMDELRRCSRRTAADPVARMADDVKTACVALDMRLQPLSGSGTGAGCLPHSGGRKARSGSDPRLGELVVKVYVFTRQAPGKEPIWKAWDEWPAASNREGIPAFRLPATMELLATGAADPQEHAAMAAQLGAAGGSAGGSGAAGSRPAGAAGAVGAGAGAGAGSAGGAAGVGSALAVARRVQVERASARELWDRVSRLGQCGRSINALLEYMVSAERPPAPQPDGLTVTMRPYQLQSLAFMLEMEALVEPPTRPAAAGSGSGSGSGSGPDSEAGGAAAAGAGPPTSNAAAEGAGAGGGAVEAGGASGRPGLLHPAADPEGGTPGGYRRLFWAPITAASGQRFWYSPVFERAALDVPPQPTGGFLAEEMGLGKTVEVMALTLANPPPPSVVAGAVAPCGRIVSRGTLVVCAVSLVGQWQAEAANKTAGSCRIHPYHGQNRIRDARRLATEFDVVVTTYQTLQSDQAGGSRSNTNPCQAILWHRIVFDEGHTLRNAGAKLAKTANELAAQRRWLCTGTPINTAVEDLLGQVAALQMAPLSKKTFFDGHIKLPFLGSHRHYHMSLRPLLFAMRYALVRHTKAQSLGGEGVLQLPNKTEAEVPVYLTAEEQELYKRIQQQAAEGWRKLKAVGPAYVNSHLFTATSMLMPLRRICSGGRLGPKDLAVPDPENLAAVAGAAAAAAAAAAAVTGAGGSGAGGAAGAAGAGGPGGGEVPIPEDLPECPICVDTMDGPVCTPCSHWFCRECITGWLNQSPHHSCPACRQTISVASLRRGVVPPAKPPPTAAEADKAKGGAAGGSSEGDDEDTDGEGGRARDDGCVPCESKLRALLAELRAMREADPTAKALVFTQFSQALEWLKPRLQAEGFGHRTITGDMPPKRRTEAITSFQNDPSTCVFLLSVRAGAVGINLTAANHVFLLEPCMNPATEHQAIGRAWRMGQSRPVTVKRLFVKGSVEETIMSVVTARRAANGGVAGGSTDGAAGAAGAATSAAGRQQERIDLRISELDQLFGAPSFPPPAAA
ncbi:hypothetical protein HYH02_010011 [Chlamydomonas schloesseri]|uniref:SNF2 super family n=1 Tax=Chlamydomonas schloesseri TaxID=2026947 RepID=A0A835TDQ9_9CHLO|nr:hypothetical protein HYH02_010011 [Chlamydomonas schloesseri]|eukprot:KAG2441423.1 hypothetical protein HYH02_010011 [Chlamydomonas schloesseri]